MGIQPRDQPPNHYRLLGLDLFEDDLEVIDAHANKQMIYLHGCATGEHAELAEKLLNEIAVARLCLLSSSKKRAYDNALRKRLGREPAASVITIEPRSVKSRSSRRDRKVLASAPIVIRTRNRTVGRSDRRISRPAMIAVGTVVMVVLGYLLFGVLFPKQPERRELSERSGDSAEQRRDVSRLPDNSTPVIAPFDAAQAKSHQQAWADHLGIPVESTNSIGMKFVVIPPGEFMMGSDRNSNATPHQVTLTRAFELGGHEVTQEHYERVMGANPVRKKVPQNPIEQVTWNDAVEFCRKLSELPEEKAAGFVYRLPTEAEWEYACRAGTASDYSFGDDLSQLGEYAWYKDNSGRTTHPVGQKTPNAWGLYDMHGNVWEWCRDWYGGYPSGAVSDPKGPSSGSLRVLRGGSWYFSSEYCRSANRSRRTPGDRDYNLGFRVVRSSVK